MTDKAKLDLTGNELCLELLALMVSKCEDGEAYFSAASCPPFNLEAAIVEDERGQRMIRLRYKPETQGGLQ